MRQNLATPVAVFIFLSVNAAAGTVSLNSDLWDEYNSITAVNVFINPHPLWQSNFDDAAWISYGLTGDGQSSPANVNGTITGVQAQAPTAIFTETFVLATAATSGFVSVWADDTARVRLVMPDLAEILLYEANPVQGGACANGSIGCLPQNGLKIDLTPLNLGAGSYAFQFDVYQRDGGPFGLLYRGEITTVDSPAGHEVPEPATLLLTGGAIAAMVWLSRKGVLKLKS